MVLAHAATFLRSSKQVIRGLTPPDARGRWPTPVRREPRPDAISVLAFLNKTPVCPRLRIALAENHGQLLFQNFSKPHCNSQLRASAIHSSAQVSGFAFSS